jgi:CrcB protein
MTTWINLMMVAAGGAVGSIARYLITAGSAALPWGSTMLGTTLANVLGCAAIGAFSEYVIVVEHVGESTQLAVRVGLLGGLTTFSTFAYESVALAESGRWGFSGAYVLGNLFLGWLALIFATTVVRGSMT